MNAKKLRMKKKRRREREKEREEQKGRAGESRNMVMPHVQWGIDVT